VDGWGVLVSALSSSGQVIHPHAFLAAGSENRQVTLHTVNPLNPPGVSLVREDHRLLS
jgi:hypothetical protein